MANPVHYPRRRRGAPFLALVALVALAGALSAAAQPPASTSEARSTGTLAGEVTTPAGEVIGDAEVNLVDLRRRTRTTADGSFRFAGLPAGSYLVEAVSLEHGEGSARVEVRPAAEAKVTIVLDLVRLQDEVVVTAGAAAQQLEMAQATTILSGEDLDQRRDASLGETLAQQPGISSTYFGPGASRPVIRGLGGDRVRMLSDGLGSADASNVSPDHAVSVDPASAERIEVLRGPSTLLYGSTAIGGVVNVLDNRIPTYAAEEPLSGSVELLRRHGGGGEAGVAGARGRRRGLRLARRLPRARNRRLRDPRLCRGLPSRGRGGDRHAGEQRPGQPVRERRPVSGGRCRLPRPLGQRLRLPLRRARPRARGRRGPRG